MVNLTKKWLSLGVMLIVGLGFATNSHAQINAGADTTICPPGGAQLIANVNGNYGTSSYTFQQVPFNPQPYTGTPVTLFDDDVQGPFPIGFTFCFLGQNYTQFYIGSNGWVSFSAGQSTAYTSAVIPDIAAAVPKNCIMGPWEDWDPGLCAGACVYYQTVGTAPNRQLVVSWDNVPMFSCTATLGSFQIACHETTGIIENHLTNKPNCPAWANGTGTQGVHNDLGTIAFTAPGRNSTQWTTNNETIQFVPSGITWWQGATQVGVGDTLNVTPSATTVYTAQVTLCDGNVYQDQVTVTVNCHSCYAPIPTAINALCNGSCDGIAYADIDPQNTAPPYDFNWYDSANNLISSSTNLTVADTAFGLCAGTYTVEITDTTGCTIDTTFTIGEPTQVTVTASSNTIICPGDSALLNATAAGGTSPYVLNWDNGLVGSGNVSPATNTCYTVIATDNNGCTSASDVMCVDIHVLQTLSLSAPAEICLGESAALSATTNGGNVIWSTGANGNNTSDSPTVSTMYYATAIGICDTVVDSIFVIVNPLPVANAGLDGETPLGIPADLTGSGGVSYSWSPSTVVNCPSCPNTTALILSSTTFALTVTDANGCSAVDSVLITLLENVELWVPNVFSPNGDGINDELMVYGAFQLKSMLFTVYNRWGEKVFESTDPEEGWDGTQNGGTLTTGVFAYVVRGVSYLGEEHVLSGDVTLLRKSN
jgi:gliding motility-associated-like protein